LHLHKYEPKTDCFSSLQRAADFSGQVGEASSLRFFKPEQSGFAYIAGEFGCLFQRRISNSLLDSFIFKACS